MLQRRQLNYEQYGNHLDEKLPQIKAGPIQQRSCKDVFCLVIFAMIIIINIGLGFYFLIGGYSNLKSLNIATNDQFIIGSAFVKNLGIIIAMLVVSLTLAIIFILLCRFFPKPMVYTMIVGTFMIYAAIIFLAILLQIYVLAIIVAIVVAINILILCCYWSYIRVGIALLQCAGMFITQKPAVYGITFINLIITIIYFTLWIIGFIGGSSLAAQHQDKPTAWNILLIIWLAIGIFFSLFFYYCMVFMIGSAAAYWYYRNPGNSVLAGLKHIPFNLGSLVFAAIVVTIINILKKAAQSKRNQAGGGGLGTVMFVIYCMVACCLSCMEQLIKVLNHNAVIIMSVTSQNYCDAAKSTIGLIFRNLGLFMIVDFFTNFLQFYALIICAIIPAIAGAVIAYFTAQESVATRSGLYVGIIILVLGSFISNIILGMLFEALSCIYIFYCFDRKFQEQGMKIDNIPQPIKNLFNEHYHDGDLQMIEGGTGQNLNNRRVQQHQNRGQHNQPHPPPITQENFQNNYFQQQPYNQGQPFNQGQSFNQRQPYNQGYPYQQEPFNQQKFQGQPYLQGQQFQQGPLLNGPYNNPYDGPHNGPYNGPYQQNLPPIKGTNQNYGGYQ